MKRIESRIAEMTARGDQIRADDNPDYYAIVKQYYELTGIPSLVNTSFNIHDEPIVHTADDALKAFHASQLDALVLGNHLILAPMIELPRDLARLRALA